MIMESSLQQLLATTLDSLLEYVNSRHHIVTAIGDADSADHEARMQLVERYLWSHKALIDDFVRDNPDQLPQACLSAASDLAGTLYGTLYLERHDDTVATIVHQTGTYLVSDPTRRLCMELERGPLEIRGAIAPFAGSIVAIPPFAVMGLVSSELLSNIHLQLSSEGIDQPTSDASVLTKRVHAWGQQPSSPVNASDSSFDCPGPGYHVGPLAHMDKEERSKARTRHADEEALRSGAHQRSLEIRSVEATRIPQTLEEALSLLDDDWLLDIADDLDGRSVSRALSHDQLVTLVHQSLSFDQDQCTLAVTWCADEIFELIGTLLRANPLPLDRLAPSIVSCLFPMAPLVFMFRVGDSTLAWMPPEAMAALSTINLSAIRRIRKRLAEARDAASGLATTCGIITVSDVYDRYRRAVRQPLDRNQFEAALEELQSDANRDDYVLWEHAGQTYVVSVEISDASAPARVTRESYAEHVVQMEGMDDQPGFPTFVNLTLEDEVDFMQRLRRKEQELELMRLSLLAHDRGPQPLHELMPQMLTEAPIAALMGLPALQALRDFVECHIPDGQDDWGFGELFVRSVVVSAVLMHEHYNETMDIIRLYDMVGCEDTTFPDTLGRLVTNAYNALPRWELGGWSLEECTERLTGRKRFFRPDGTVRTVSDDESCPCGSGKPYGKCCGHLRT